MTTVKFKKLTETAIVPTRATSYAAGLDLYVDEEVFLLPNQFRMVSTGVAIELPPGYEGQVRARSGLAAKYGVGIVNSPGTIDEDYRGEVKVILVNHGNGNVLFHRGERIAQLVIAPVSYPSTLEVKELSPAPTRGDKGFGSSGR